MLRKLISWLRETDRDRERRYGRASFLLGLIDKGLEEDGICSLHVRITPYGTIVPDGFKADGNILGRMKPRLVSISLMYVAGLLVVHVGDHRKQFKLDQKEPGQVMDVVHYIQEQFEAAIL